MVEALSDSQWQAVRYFRQLYWSDRLPQVDEETEVFHHPDHRHLVLYQGIQIIGYAHIRLWSDHRAALQVLVIDPDYRRRGIGSRFLNWIERWLKEQ